MKLKLVVVSVITKHKLSNVAKILIFFVVFTRKLSFYDCTNLLIVLLASSQAIQVACSQDVQKDNIAKRL